MKRFASLPTQHRLSLSQLSTHEYFGEDMIAGRSQPALFAHTPFRGKTSYRVVWTYGKWDHFGLTEGEEVEFFHTQTNARKRMMFQRVLGLDESGTKKIPQWTLK